MGANASYFDMLCRAGLHGMPDCKADLMKRFKVNDSSTADDWCKNPSAPQLRMLEDMLIAKMAQMQRAQMNAAQREAVDKMRTNKSDEYLRAAAQMEHCVADNRVKNYAVDSALLAYYANAMAVGNTAIISASASFLTATGTSVGTSVGTILGSAAVGTAAIGIGAILVGAEVLHHAFGADLGKLWPVVYAVLSQRVLLLTSGIEIEEFYPHQFGTGTSLASGALGDAGANVLLLNPERSGAPAVQLGVLQGQLKHKLAQNGGMEMVEERLTKAEMKLEQVVVPEAIALLEKAKMHEGGQIAAASADIATAVATAVHESTAVALIKELVAVPEQSVDAAEMLTAAQAVVGQAVGRAQKLSDDEQSQLKERAAAVLAEAKEISKDSALAQQVLQKGTDMLASVTGSASEDGSSLSQQLAKGKAAAEVAQSPRELYTLLANDTEFVDACKTMCLQYVEQAVTNIELPPIEGPKNWGKYTMAGLAVRALAVSPSALTLNVANAVTVNVAGVSVEFDPFTWGYTKTTWPSLSDTGTACATIIELEVSVTFTLGTDTNATLALTSVDVVVDMGALNVEVLTSHGSGGRKWIMNMMIGAFRERIKVVVLHEIRSAVGQQIPVLRGKLGQLTELVTARLAPTATGAVAQLRGGISTFNEGVIPSTELPVTEQVTEPQPTTQSATRTSEEGSLGGASGPATSPTAKSAGFARA
jgi:hypothetical protein